MHAFIKFIFQFRIEMVTAAMLKRIQGQSNGQMELSSPLSEASQTDIKH